MKKIALILVLIMLVILSGCGKENSSVIDEFDILVDGKTADIDFKEGMSLFYSGDNSIEITDSDDNFSYVDGELSVMGVELGDNIDEVIEKLKIKPGYADFDYEHDPYGDGCTEISSEIYDGTLPDMDELHVLDLNMKIAYYKDGDSWTMINFEDSNIEDFETVIAVSVDFNGVCELYAEEPGVAVSITAALF